MTINRRMLLTTAITGFAASTLTPNPALAFFSTLFTPKSVPWERWRRHDPNATTRIDHTQWANFLNKYIHAQPDGINRVSYGQVTHNEKVQLNSYITELSANMVSTLSRNEQLALWINLYNALTVQVIIKHLPVGSIRDIDISPGLFADGPWDAKLIKIEGEPISLNDIEHRIIRPLWEDPRAHYALNCAALGCPNLQAVPYRATTLNEQLDIAARKFINHPRGVSLKDDKLTASSIYKWFEEDFGSSDKAVLAHLIQYAKPELVATLNAHSKIDDYEYDWKLNGTP